MERGKSFSIEPFDGKNFEKWCFKMVLLLKKEKLFTDIVDHLPAQKDRTAEWEQKNLDAMFLIGTNVSDEYLEFVKGHEHAYEMYEALKRIHGKESDHKIVRLREELFGMKFRAGDEILQYVVKFRSLCRRLSELGDATTTRQNILILLKSLPTEFAAIRAVLGEKKTLSWDDTTAALDESNKQFMTKTEPTSEEGKAMIMHGTGNVCHNSNRRENYNPNVNNRNFNNRHNSNRTENSSPSNNVNNQSDFVNDRNDRNNVSYRNSRFKRHGNKNFSNRNRNFKVRCHYCGKDGHIARYCRAKQNRSSNNCHLVEADTHGKENNGISFLTINSCFNVDSVNNSIDARCNDVTFFLDSASTKHIVNDIELFSEFKHLNTHENFIIANKKVRLSVTGIGTIRLKTPSNDNIKLVNVCYAEDIPSNLLSVKCISDAGFVCVFYKDHADIIYRDSLATSKPKTLMRCELKQLYVAQFFRVNEGQTYAIYDSNVTKAELWHKRLAHVNYKDLKLLKSQNLLPINEKEKIIESFCEPCVFGKQARNPFPSNKSVTRFPLELVHTDVCVVSSTSYDNRKYFITFLDDFSHFCHVSLMASKAEVLDKFKEYHALVTNRFNRNICRLRCDRGTEYLNDAFKSFCNSNGIHVEPTMAYSPQQNGKAERYNRTIVERARTLLSESGLDRIYWSEALLCANFVINRCPSNGIVPYNRWYGTNFDYSKLKVFGCDAYRLTYKHSGNKMIDKGEKLVFVGYAPGGYRLLNLNTRKIHLSRDVKFNENACLKDTVDVNVNVTNSDNSDDENNVTNMCFLLDNYINDSPKNFKEALRTRDAPKWWGAIKKEYDAIVAHNTWELVDRPAESVITSRWVFTKKVGVDKSEVFKARLVARGFEQNSNLEYDEIYSPVARLATVRTLLAVSNEKNYHIHQLDICNAFLNGHLNEPVFMEIPDGIYTNVNRNEKVLKLNKSLYGLKQSPKAWNVKFNEFIVSLGFVPSQADECLYTRNKNGTVVYLLLYVDDILICADELEIIEKFKRIIGDKFKCRDLGEINNFLGLNVTYNKDEGIVKINQSKLIAKIAKRFNVDDCHPIKTPMEERLQLKRCQDKSKLTKLPYRELIGCLMYLMLGSRPDITYAVSFFSMFQDAAENQHFYYLLRVLKYLNSTKDLNLTYVRNKSSQPFALFCDADWANCNETRRSVSGACALVFGNVIFWYSRKQSSVTLSSTESELVSLCTGVREAVWLKSLLISLDINVEKRCNIYEDNQGVLKLIKSANYNSKRSKHIDTQFKFLTEKYTNRDFNFIYVESNKQLGDIFTKSLGKLKFEMFVNYLNLI